MKFKCSTAVIALLAGSMASVQAGDKDLYIECDTWDDCKTGLKCAHIIFYDFPYKVCFEEEDCEGAVAGEQWLDEEGNTIEWGTDTCLEAPPPPPSATVVKDKEVDSVKLAGEGASKDNTEGSSTVAEPVEKEEPVEPPKLAYEDNFEELVVEDELKHEKFTVGTFFKFD